MGAFLNASASIANTSSASTLDNRRLLNNLKIRLYAGSNKDIAVVKEAVGRK